MYAPSPCYFFPSVLCVKSTPRMIPVTLAITIAMGEFADQYRCLMDTMDVDDLLLRSKTRKKYTFVIKTGARVLDE